MRRPADLKAAALGTGVAAAVAGAVLLVPGRDAMERTTRPAAPAPPACLTAAPPAAAPPGCQAQGLSGARAAALGYLRLSEAVVSMDEGQALAAQRQAATAGAGERLAADLAAKLSRLRAALGDTPVSYRVAPLAARASPTAPELARVEVWYVGVVAPAGGASWDEWRLARYDLAFEAGAWRVAGEASEPGPRPGAQDLGTALSGFTSVAASG